MKKWDEVETLTQNASLLTRFQFHRTRHALLETLGSDLAEPPEVVPLTHTIKNDSPNQIVSNIYRLAQGYRANHYTKARLAWQADLGTDLDDTTWRYCCESTKLISLNGRHRLIHFKFLNMVYFTSERLHRYVLCDSAKCERCGENIANVFHLAWLCPGLLTSGFRFLKTWVTLLI